MANGARRTLRARPFRRSRRASSDHSNPHGASATQIPMWRSSRSPELKIAVLRALQHHHHQHRDHRAGPGVPADHRRHARREQHQAHDQPGVVAREVGEQVPRTRAERALVEQVVLHEERIDVGQQADRPDRRGGTPADPHEGHRRGALRPEEEAIPGRHAGRWSARSSGRLRVGRCGTRTRRRAVAHRSAGSRGTAARAAPSRPVSRARRTATRSTGRWAPTGCGSRRIEPARATSASGSSGGSPRCGHLQGGATPRCCRPRRSPGPRA